MTAAAERGPPTGSAEHDERVAAKGGVVTRLREQTRAKSEGKPEAPDPEAAAAPAVRDATGAAGTAVARTDPAQSAEHHHADVRARSSRRGLRNPILLSFALLVLLPALLATVYYAGVANDRYVAEASFAIRGNSPAPSDPLGAITGLPAYGASSVDAMIVAAFIGSRDLFLAIDAELDLVRAFGRDDVDWWSRLPPASSIEDRVAYWRDMIDVDFETSSGISTLTVQAFTPEDAKAIADEILARSEILVNRLSARARYDAVAFAQAELADAEARLRAARQALTDFRDQRQALDPVQVAESRLGIVAELEGELTRAQTEFATLSTYMQADAARVVALQNRIAAIEEQLALERSRLASKRQGDEVMSRLLADYENLAAEREFAANLYQGALVGLEAARNEANRKHRYLASFIEPALPGEATRPRRVMAIASVSIGCLLAWSVGLFMLAAVRDHAGWT